MNILSIDPGATTGFAVIDYEIESVYWWGELKTASLDFVPSVNEIMNFEQGCERLIIEDQYFDRKANNPASLIKLAASRGQIEGIWISDKEFRQHEIVRVKPSSWQACLNLPARAIRAQLKAAAKHQAALMNNGHQVSPDEADAICMGFWWIRKDKAEKLKLNALTAQAGCGK